MSSREQIKAVAAVLKAKFTNLTVSETIDLALDVIAAYEQAPQKESR